MHWYTAKVISMGRAGVTLRSLASRIPRRQARQTDRAAGYKTPPYV